MRILFVNVCLGYGSTGKIVAELASKLENDGNKVFVAYGTDSVPDVYQHFAHKIGNRFEYYIHIILSRFLDIQGMGSIWSTKRFLKWANKFNPDVLWLHNIHGYYINYELLFKWIKLRPEMVVKWTLHDCWAFTGHCAYFSYEKCEKWKIECEHCLLKKSYPSSYLIDNSKNNFKRKKKSFVGVKCMQLITPSRWLAGLVSESFLKDYHIEVVYNDIDRNIFKPTPSDFRTKYNLVEKKIILGVAYPWSNRKGLNDFFKLSKMLNKSYQIVLVGLSRKQIKLTPPNIIALPRVNSASQLAAIYTAADVFVNATYDDNYPTTNLESLACGTICITYNTGGSVESVDSKYIVEQGDLISLVKLIMKVTK